jgi:hypothetical protein
MTHETDNGWICNCLEKDVPVMVMMLINSGKHRCVGRGEPKGDNGQGVVGLYDVAQD